MPISTEGDALADEIEQRLLADIRASRPQGLNSSLSLALRDETSGLIAGLSGSTSYGWLLAKVLWVAPEHRGKGHGRALMAKAEAEARRRGCHGIWLDTSMPDAEGFYRRLGYETFGVLENRPGDVTPEHRRWFLAKRLAG
ncbi:MAG: GNAT family N-acetyltransferase [Devosia sp.]